MDVKSLYAAQSYALGQKAAKPDAVSPTDVAQAVASSFEETLAATDKLTASAFFGQSDPHMLVTSLAQTELAVDAAVAVRDKVVEAYQEILRMPV